MRALLLSALLAPVAAWAGSNVRYALVIGNNHGSTQENVLEPLKHAERDARALADKLVQLGNFQADRIEVVLGESREEILRAAARLAQLHKKDREALGQLPTLFAFFFTGHGLSGRLLTSDGALDGEDLGRIFAQMDARLSLAFVDACYAGSLDLDSLKAKGAMATPGFNPIRELPKEVLDAEGMMWFVSSQSGELSYEDTDLGGLFTHFLVEGFTEAPKDRVGVSLENLWEYARQHTSAYAAQYGRRQNPERIVRKLKSRSPTYLSFPSARTASLVFDASVQGNFLLQYEDAALVESVFKQRGQALEVKAYDGDLVLTRLADAGGPLGSQRISLPKSSQVRVRPPDVDPQLQSVGFVESPIRMKGSSAELVFSQARSGTVLAIGPLYRWSFTAPDLLGTSHNLGGSIQVLHGHLSLGVSLSVGRGGERFDAWGYQTDQVAGEVGAAYGLNVSALRIDLEIAAGPRAWIVTYDDLTRLNAFGAWFGGGARFQLGVPFQKPWVIFQARVAPGLGLSRATPAADSKMYVYFAPMVEVGVSLPIVLN